MVFTEHYASDRSVSLTTGYNPGNSPSGSLKVDFVKGEVRWVKASLFRGGVSVEKTAATPGAALEACAQAIREIAAFFSEGE